MTVEADPALGFLGRQESLFAEDISRHRAELGERVHASRFLVVGGAGSIGQAVVRELFARDPRALHVVDVSENNLVELVREIRSSLGYGSGDFQALPLDSASAEYQAFVASQPAYDYILNLAALKHVRSEKDPYTLMRLVCVNVFNADALAQQAARAGSQKFFSVSTDKAANPANMMGASKRIMELFLLRESARVPVSLARFANVAFSDGSLLFGFRRRMEKRQPIAAPRDVQRYFVTEQESGQLCLLSCLRGANRELFFPKLEPRLHLASFDAIAKSFIAAQGYEPVECASEEEARGKAAGLIAARRWPCWFFDSDTTGEKEVEEFYTADEQPDFTSYRSIGVLRLSSEGPVQALDRFERAVRGMRSRGRWTKAAIVAAFREVLPGFQHAELGRYLDGRM